MTQTITIAPDPRIDEVLAELKALRGLLIKQPAVHKDCWLRIDQMAEELNCSESTVRRRVETGEIEVKNLGGRIRRYRIRRDES